jgi:hypothetical protein
MKLQIANLLQVTLTRVTYACRMRWILATALVALSGCNSSVYTRDGVTDGDTFYLAPLAWADDDPALQSWVTYSLVRSACQLEIGGDNPARNSEYGCEFTARRHLVDAWEQQRSANPGAEDPYLDALLRVRKAGFLDEYTVRYFGRDDWVVPAEVRVQDFRRWQRRHLRGHKPETRMIGSWNYSPL